MGSCKFPLFNYESNAGGLGAQLSSAASSTKQKSCIGSDRNFHDTRHRSRSMIRFAFQVKGRVFWAIDRFVVVAVPAIFSWMMNLNLASAKSPEVGT